MIMFYNLGMDCHVQSVPCIAPAVGAALITAGAGMFGSMINSSTQQSSNKDYLKGVRETNQANKELYEKQMNDVRQNYAIEKANDTPAMQLARLRQAGINSSSTITGSTGQQIQSVTPFPAQAPAQTPNPFGDMNLGGIARDAISAYQAGQQISDTQMSLYQHGIDSVFYYQKTLNGIKGEMLDLLSKDNRNKTEDERLRQLYIQGKYVEKELQNHMQQAQDLHDQTQASIYHMGSEVDHWFRSDQVAQYRAETERSLAYVERKRVDAYVQDTFLRNLREDAKELREQSDWERFNQDFYDLEKRVKSMSEKEKEYTLSLIMDEAIRSGWDTESWFNEKMHRIFGFNFDRIFHAGATFGTFEK